MATELERCHHEEGVSRTRDLLLLEARRGANGKQIPPRPEGLVAMTIFKIGAPACSSSAKHAAPAIHAPCGDQSLGAYATLLPPLRRLLIDVGEM